jgi:dephospho-CoA kinase
VNRRAKRIIGIVGPIACGKDLAANYISAKLGIPRFQISQPLRDIAAERGIVCTREALIKLGREVATELGSAYLVKVITRKIREAGVIAGMRQLDQLHFLRESCDFTLLAIDAPPIVRFERAKAHDKLGEAKTLAEFMILELEENSPPHVQRLFECMALADATIVNDGTKEDLYRQVDAFLDDFYLQRHRDLQTHAKPINT